MDEILKVTTLNKLGGITIPKMIREILSLKINDSVFFIKSNDEIIIRGENQMKLFFEEKREKKRKRKESP